MPSPSIFQSVWFRALVYFRAYVAEPLYISGRIRAPLCFGADGAEGFVEAKPPGRQRLSVRACLCVCVGGGGGVGGESEKGEDKKVQRGETMVR